MRLPSKVAPSAVWGSKIGGVVLVKVRTAVPSVAPCTPVLAVIMDFGGSSSYAGRMRNRTFFLSSISALLLFSIAGCGGNGETSATGGDGGGTTTGTGGTTTGTGGATTGTGGAGGDTAGPDDVTGTIIESHETPSGTVEKPADPADVELSAIVPKGDGTFDTIPAQYSADGSFVIKSVPMGEYYLHIGRTYLATSARTHDLGSRWVNRADAQAATSPTPMVFSVTNMSPWADLDTLEVFSAGAGAWGDVSGAIDPAQYPTTGQTSLSSFGVDTQLLVVNDLVDGGKGDTLFLTQNVTQMAGAVPYSSLGRTFVPAAFSQVNGQSKALSGAFQTVPQKQVSLDFRRTEFAAFEAAVNPSAAASDFYVYAYGEPGGKVDASTSGAPTIFQYSDSDLSDTPLDLSYGNPFPDTWGVSTGLFVYYSAAFTPPGQQQLRALFCTASIFGDVDDLVGKPISPAISPPKGLTIDGKEATGVLTGVGESPEVAWSAPDTGVAAAYRVTVRKLNAMPPATTVAYLYTDLTHVTLPPGILTPGEPFYLRVSALTSYDKSKPFHYKVAGAEAETMSGPFVE